jgi:hypothetical protein
MLRGLLLLVATGLVSTDSCHACLWLHGTTIEGHYQRVSDVDHAEWLKGRVDEKPANVSSFFVPFEYHPDDPAARANDTAVQVLLKGDPARAVVMLQELESTQPGNYYTAANLGTAYELAGDDTKALEWIKEGIRRNPESHMHTEWLHARILEAKIALKSDPRWLDTRTITGADLTQLKNPSYTLPTLQRPVGPKDLRDSLRSQLGVRVLFVKPKDAIVAQLLKELALVEAHVGFLQQALGYADLAERYGLHSDALRTERAEWRETIRNTPPILEGDWPRRVAQYAPVLVVLTLAFLVGALILLRRMRKRKAASAA